MCAFDECGVHEVGYDRGKCVHCVFALRFPVPVGGGGTGGVAVSLSCWNLAYGLIGAFILGTQVWRSVRGMVVMRCDWVRDGDAAEPSVVLRELRCGRVYVDAG